MASVPVPESPQGDILNVAADNPLQMRCIRAALRGTVWHQTSTGHIAANAQRSGKTSELASFVIKSGSPTISERRGFPHSPSHGGNLGCRAYGTDAALYRADGSGDIDVPAI